MQLKSILNRVQLHPGFVYGAIRWRDPQTRMILDVEIRFRQGGRPVCSKCGQTGPGYDRLSGRHFEFVPLWGLTVFFLYALRRVNCATCGVKVERIPWATGKHQLTTS